MTRLQGRSGTENRIPPSVVYCAYPARRSPLGGAGPIPRTLLCGFWILLLALGGCENTPERSPITSDDIQTIDGSSVEVLDSAGVRIMRTVAPANG